MPRIAAVLRSTLRRSFLLLGLAASAPPAVLAQEPADTFLLGELVVTATRVPVPRAAVPAAVTVVQGAELRARGVRFLADALRDVAGASLVRSGSTGGLTSLFLRGGESDYVQVMVDGVVVNDPGGAVDLGQLTTDDVERIEVVRGPVSVLYGSDAVTGVVHVITRRAAGAGRVTADVEVGTGGRRAEDLALCDAACPAPADLHAYATRRVAASAASAAAGGRLDWALGGSEFRSDGAYPFNNAYRNRSVHARLAARGTGTDAALAARYTDGRYRYPTDGAGRLVDANTFRSTESVAVGLDAGRAWGARLETRATLSLHRGVSATVDRPDHAADTLGFFASRNDGRVERRKAGAHANLRAGRGTVATLGVEAERQEGTSDFTSESEYGPYASATANDRSNRAVYGQVASAPWPWLALTVGGRLEDNDRFGRFRTGRGGVNLRPDGRTVLRASAGTGFKEPTFYENYAEGFVLGNPALAPERARSWEVGAERVLLGGLARVSGTWFAQTFRDLIQYAAAPAPGTPNYVNVGEAVARGFELEAGAGRADGIRVRASWVRLHTEVTDQGTGEDPLFVQGQPLLRRPRNRFDASAVAPLGDRGSVGMRLVHAGARADLDFVADPAGLRVTLPGHTVADVFADARLWSAGARTVDLTVRVDNALGADYDEIANFPGARRALYLGVSATTGF